MKNSPSGSLAMGHDKIRHLRTKPLAGGALAYFWQPSETIKNLGMVAEPLGSDRVLAERRARELNTMADEMRTQGHSTLIIAPGTVSRLFADYQKSIDVVGDPAAPALKGLKPRTRKDLDYYLGKIEVDFGKLPVAAISPRVVKEHYHRMVRERGVTWAYHIVWAWRCALSWGVSQDWIKTNPALAITVMGPPKRRVQWKLEEAERFIAQAAKDGWRSIAVAADLMDCTAQSPVDIWKLKVRDYARGFIVDGARAKTGHEGAPIELWPEVRARLESYLEMRPALHPDAPLLANDRTEKAWIESTRHKTIGKVRHAAGLRAELQFQDFRRTAQNEARAAGATSVEIQHLARHASPTTQQRYLQPDGVFVRSVQQKRRTHRQKARKSGGESN